MENTRIFTRVVLLVLLVSLAGCFSAKPEDVEAFLRPSEADVSADEYIIHPPDTITVIASQVPELQGTTRSIGHTQTVRPDGSISFETLGEVHVAGKTPKQIATMLSEKLITLYNFTHDNPIDVRVNNRSKFYYILGMVRHPGAQYFSGRETTLSAVSKAIPNVQAWEEQIQIIRPSVNLTGEPKIFRLDFKRMIEHGDMTGNVLLQEGDVIYVPPTILGSIGLTLQEIVGPLRGGASIASDFETLSDNDD